MIVVTVGTNEARFDRLLRAVDGLTFDEPLLIQYGHSSPIAPPNAESVDFLPFDAMVEKIRSARAVVTHAGVGSIMVALANGKRPIVVPRRKSFGEAVDDHQLQLGRRFAQAGLVTYAETAEEIGQALAQEHEQEPATVVTTEGSLAADLRSFLEDAVGRSVPARA